MNQSSEADAVSPRDPALAGVGGPDPKSPSDRPEFMAFLGLLPPYTIEDVQKAYKARAVEMHPDRGGSKEDFVRLQEVYEEAQEYVRFVDGRRQWLANQVEPYLRQQEIVQEVEQRSGTVVIEKVEWMQRSFGDFAALAERLREINLRGIADANEFMAFLAERSKDLRFLVAIDLAGSSLGDEGVRHVKAFRGLQRLNVAGTLVTVDGLASLESLPDLSWLNVGGTPIGWLGRRKLGSLLSGTEIVNQPRA